MKTIKQEILDFVYYMIHSKSLTRDQQARRDKLFARDSLSIQKNIIENDKLVREKVKYVSPKNLHIFLFRYNQDSILKYTCHEIDTVETIAEICHLCGTESYSIKKHTEIIDKAFKQLTKALKDDNVYLDSKMYALISVYLTGKTKSGKTEWSTLNIKTNWSSKALFEWGDNNPNIIPSPGMNIARKQRNRGYELPKAYISNLSGNRILSFNELVIYFKSLFHIRRDNSLRDLILYQNEIKKLNNSKINIVFSETMFRDNIELFTDVEKLIQAYYKIIMICKKCREKDETDESINIELSFFEENGDVFFCIHDKNSVYKKNLSAAIGRIGDLHADLIKNQINGLCDLYIEADFDNNEYARIALWNENSKPLDQTPNVGVERIENCQGVKYILKF